jgi:hypothetical protein
MPGFLVNSAKWCRGILRILNPVRPTPAVWDPVGASNHPLDNPLKKTPPMLDFLRVYHLITGSQRIYNTETPCFYHPVLTVPLYF